jgi:hypothetical protein
LAAGDDIWLVCAIYQPHKYHTLNL